MKWVKSKRQREKEKKREERKWVITMASYALQRHLVWRTESRIGQNKEETDMKKVA